MQVNWLERCDWALKSALGREKSLRMQINWMERCDRALQSALGREKSLRMQVNLLERCDRALQSAGAPLAKQHSLALPHTQLLLYAPCTTDYLYSKQLDYVRHFRM